MVAAFALILLSAPAYAVAIIDFGTGDAGSGGTITISGGNAIGVAIPIDSLTVNGTAFDKVYNLSGTAASSNQDGDLAAALIFDTTQNSISIIGGIPELFIPDQTVLLTGTFSSFELQNGLFVGSLEGTGPDVKSPLLLRALGLPTDTKFEFYGFSIGFNTKGTGSPYTATSTDIINTEVPEPGSLILIGSGLLGLYKGTARSSRRLRDFHGPPHQGSQRPQSAYRRRDQDQSRQAAGL
jgi:hypothetical protein